MGTNFYIRKKLNDTEKEMIKKLIDEDKYDEAKELFPKKIHIGKRSCGWKFLWDVHNFNYFDPTPQSLIDFTRDWGQIEDEYGEEFTFDQFWNDEIKNFLDSGWDIHQYYKEHPDEYRHSCMSAVLNFKENTKTKNLDINMYGEFYLGKFRCTNHEDFG